MVTERMYQVEKGRLIDRYSRRCIESMEKKGHLSISPRCVNPASVFPLRSKYRNKLFDVILSSEW